MTACIAMAWMGIAQIKEEMILKKRHLTLAILAGLLSAGGGADLCLCGT